MKNENIEMKMWSSYPQKIDSWDTNIDYVMFIDENGNSGKINDIFKKDYITKKFLQTKNILLLQALYLKKVIIQKWEMILGNLRKRV